MTIVRAKICWLNLKPIGRELPPKTPWHWPAKFDDAEEDWTILAVSQEEPDESLCIVTSIKFYFEDAPKHLLRQGSKFKLMSGTNGDILAEGTIL
ncbi:hypothetical protein G3578_18485 [Brevibacillus sp. SYP-B805]|uniref:hypothetical protein n=1 Tax=Brevibacillus sp. SYP-B805 TaxID=1578199 RepID=UPI0013EB06C9|nr:hypothetical protein [Brevibacillus sp. SYP-B805]NGQ97129.1 hypothetical protein [Brevibacillus sp. SYP-B805]